MRGSKDGVVHDTIYFNDDTPKNITWYWNVRNRVEELCGNKIIFHKIERKRK